MTTATNVRGFPFNYFITFDILNTFFSSTLVSASNQLYQSVAKLIKLCDDYLLIGEKALGKENVADILNLVENAIQVIQLFHNFLLWTA